MDRSQGGYPPGPTRDSTPCPDIPAPTPGPPPVSPPSLPDAPDPGPALAPDSSYADSHTATPGTLAPGDTPAPPAPHRQILALDVGRRRIGVAISDPLGITAQPLLTLHRSTERTDIRSLARLVRRYNVAEIVVGDPLHLSGAESPQALKVRRLADALGAATGATIHLLDERLTTADAHALLDASGPRVTSRNTRRDRDAVIDQVAAVLLLDAFLSMRSPRLLPPPPDL